MRRLYLQAPDQESCRLLVEQLTTHGVPEAHLHVVAGAGRDLGGLPPATARPTTEIAKGVVIGVLIGGGAGLLAGLLGQALPPPGLQISSLIVLASILAGAIFGGVVSALMKSHQHNRRLARFHAGMEAGGVVLMVDAAKSEMKDIKSVLGRHHPGVLLETAKSVY